MDTLDDDIVKAVTDFCEERKDNMDIKWYDEQHKKMMDSTKECLLNLEAYIDDRDHKLEEYQDYYNSLLELRFKIEKEIDILEKEKEAQNEV